MVVFAKEDVACCVLEIGYKSVREVVAQGVRDVMPFRMGVSLCHARGFQSEERVGVSVYQGVSAS